ncbi:cation transport protein-domain-containing protein [Crepidotus variabilis]|uniref:Potassium transport protein n=1 Tax=Crepidotus variabilis TaxID=179855 RepID=A0A9P6JQI9_9AGAR|nr:cation transport protein-domain-containing protein [Crepidotus variabilis]
MTSFTNGRSTADGDEDEEPQKKSIWKQIGCHLNFYRVHLLFFTFAPILFSIIFYSSNGRYKISYVDSLFNCVSAMMVCGLATVDLSTLTPFQQVLLFVQMCIGNQVAVSWVMVIIRKFFFAKKFEHILRAKAASKAADIVAEAAVEHKPLPHRVVAFFKGRHISVKDEDSDNEDVENPSQGVIRKLRPDMIRRMDDAPKLVNPSGWVSEGGPTIMHKMTFLTPQISEKTMVEEPIPKSPTSTIPNRRPFSVDASIKRQRRLSDPGHLSRAPSPASNDAPIHRFDTVADSSPLGVPKRFPRTQTIEFAPSPRRGERGRSMQLSRAETNGFREGSSARDSNLHEPTSMQYRRQSLSAPYSIQSHHTHPRQKNSRTRGFGGFPTPWRILRNIISRIFPTRIKQTLVRTMTIPASISLAPSVGEAQSGAKQVPYISFEAIVGRNSAFHLLTNDQLEEVGGVEYRALNALFWIVPIYHIGIQLISFIVIAPYISQPQWQPVFQDQQKRSLNTVWFSAFQVVSAYTNTGMSLVDQSMLPFQSARVMIIFIIILVLAGNTAFPIFLRFSIWATTKFVRKNSRLNETLHFLLDHPRRCFIYLFPSHQTWFLLTIVLGLTCIDWFCFLILDIHDQAIESIPINIRVLDGLMQAIAVRAAGFGIVPLAMLAPAVKVLYVVMMYISVYPIAMSVRSTNVYEEQSLGVFNDHDPNDDNDENKFVAAGSRLTVWSRYLAMHARRQLAFDMWWMALSLFIICIIERNHLDNPDNFGWFNVFNIIFELVSAYGTVGLSLGIPTQNYSFSGAFHPLSKLIVCAVMLRGRHRGLPVAIDRAIMLPSEVQQAEEVFFDNASTHRAPTEASGNPYRRSDTIISHRSSGTSEIRHRAPRQPSKIFHGDDLELVPEQREKRSLSADEESTGSASSS